MNSEVSAPRQLRVSVSFDGRRDWPVACAAVTALLSFIMLFPPWVSGDTSLNAFGKNMPAAGPALIIVMALAVLALIGLGIATGLTRYQTFALLPASNLLVIYIVKLADTSDLIDQVSASGSDYNISIGAGLWLGFLFSLATLVFLIVQQALMRGFLVVKVSREHNESDSQ
jgi:hypothetical protein